MFNHSEYNKRRYIIRLLCTTCNIAQPPMTSYLEKRGNDITTAVAVYFSCTPTNSSLKHPVLKTPINTESLVLSKVVLYRTYCTYHVAPSLGPSRTRIIPRIRHIPTRDKQAFAQVLSSTLMAIMHENTEQAWLRLLMLPKCVPFFPSGEDAITRIQLPVKLYSF